MKRTPIRRKTPLRSTRSLSRRRRIPAQSAKRAKTNRTRTTLKKRLLDERGPWCQAGVEGVCTGLAVDLHETWTRARSGGRSLLDERYMLLVCRGCHEWVGRFPAKAERRGLLVPSWKGDA